MWAEALLENTLGAHKQGLFFGTEENLVHSASAEDPASPNGNSGTRVALNLTEVVLNQGKVLTFCFSHPRL